MSVEEIQGAQLCANITCPISDNFILPTGCLIPYNSTAEEYCTSVKLGNITQMFVVVSVALYSLGVGASMDIEKLKHAIRNPKAPLVGLFAQTVLNPLMMFGILAIFGSAFPFATKLMAVLISSAPGGNGSNLFSLLAYGSVELSVTMTCFSTFMAFATMPFYVFIATNVIWKDEASTLKVNFMTILVAAAVATGLPALGLFIKTKGFERTAQFFSKYGVVVGLIGVLVGAVMFLFDPLFVEGLAGLGWQIWVCAVLLNVFGLVLGYTVSVLARLPYRFHRTIAFEVGAQNVTIPLAIVTLSFGAGPVASLFVPFVGVYLLTSLVPNYGALAFFRYVLPIHGEHHDGFDEGEKTKGVRACSSHQGSESSGDSVDSQA